MFTWSSLWPCSVHCVTFSTLVKYYHLTRVAVLPCSRVLLRYPVRICYMLPWSLRLRQTGIVVAGGQIVVQLCLYRSLMATCRLWVPVCDLKKSQVESLIISSLLSLETSHCGQTRGLSALWCQVLSFPLKNVWNSLSNVNCWSPKPFHKHLGRSAGGCLCLHQALALIPTLKIPESIIVRLSLWWWRLPGVGK